MKKKGKRIVLTSYGSFGDIHPYIAIALGLKARGHSPLIATCEFHRTKVESEGIEFHSMRPDITDEQIGSMNLILNAKSGPEFIIRRLTVPYIRLSYMDLIEAVTDADLIVTHPFTFAGPLVAKKTGIKWVSSILAPMGFLSSYDPSVLTSYPALAKLRRLGPTVNKAIMDSGRITTRSWGMPVRRLCRELEIPAAKDPIFHGQQSPFLILALFSKVMAAPQPDWPSQAVVTGFPFYDRRNAYIGMPEELQKFLDNGPNPIIFTLGTSAIYDAGSFYVESVKAARKLGMRAVLLAGDDPRNLPFDELPEGIISCVYAPHSKVFPRAAAIVHHGGIGTTAQVLRSGKPMIVMPYSLDQPDNAARVDRLGVSKTIPRSQYNASRVAAELKELINNPSYRENARAISKIIRSEDGVNTACVAIEKCFKQ